MRLLSLFGVAGLLLGAQTPVTGQQHHGPDDRRASAVMNFDQARTTHHFRLFTDGGAIDVSVKDRADTTNREAIRAHLPHIAALFGGGNFDAPMLVHDTTNVPGTSVMAARKAAIRYRYVKTPDGGRVDIQTADPEALAAVHAFLRFQIADHKTGDSLAARPR